MECLPWSGILEGRRAQTIYSKNTTSYEQEPGLLRKTADFRFEADRI